MDMMAIRRRVLLGGKKVIDTSPKIAEYGVYWNREQGGKTANDNWCITELYTVISAPKGGVKVMGFVGADSSSITFQYNYANGNSSRYYFNNVYPRKIPMSTSTSLASITFSIETDEIVNSYAYIVETGQILFAGKNTPYYGYTNVNDMP